MTAFVGSRGRPRLRSALPVGFFAGLCLGVCARVWMRSIAVDPEFTWSGTLGILFGFGLFGLAQSGAAVARQGTRRLVLSVSRVLGVFAMLPLFVAAGAPMLPTVVGGGLALSRTDWRPRVRLALVAVAALPLAVVSWDLIGKFGASLQTAVGVIGMIAVYAAIVWATKFSFAPRSDGWRLPRWATATALVAGCVLVAVPLAIGGIQ